MNKPQILVGGGRHRRQQPDRHHTGNPATTSITRRQDRRRRRAGGALSYSPDVMLLDLGLPDMDGVEIIKKIRAWCNLPIIVVSARSEDSDKMDALDAGADDYLTKPFSVEELLARLRVALRRRAL